MGQFYSFECRKCQQGYIIPQGLLEGRLANLRECSECGETQSVIYMGMVQQQGLYDVLVPMVKVGE